MISGLLAVQISFATDQTANSCSQPDVQSAINACVNSGGGTVYIPECSPNPYTWTNGVSSTSSSIFYIEGAGQDKTKIFYTGSGTVFNFRAANSGFRGMSHLEFKGNDGGKGFYFGVNSHVELNVHHITIGNFHTGGTVIGYYGVFHHCLFDTPGTNTNPYGVYVYGLPSDDWPIKDGRIEHTYGSRDALYFEDCTWHGYGHATSGFCSAKYVVRNSTRIDGLPPGLDMHQSSYSQCWNGSSWVEPKNGGYQMEIYDNVLDGTGIGYGIYHRSGGLIATDNQFSDDFDNGITIVCEGPNDGPKCTPENDSPLDNYDNNNCSDSDDGCCMRPDSVYVWNNKGCTGCKFGLFAVAKWGCSSSLREGKEYFLRPPTIEDDGFTYTKFTYPHPLASKAKADGPPAPPEDLRLSTLMRKYFLGSP